MKDINRQKHKAQGASVVATLPLLSQGLPFIKAPLKTNAGLIPLKTYPTIMSFRNQISKTGARVEELRKKNRLRIKDRKELINKTKNHPGLYWIETNMPIREIISAVMSLNGVKKEIRKTKPSGVGFTKQENGLQIIYSGTKDNIQSRLLEHLFNEGNKKTAKMSLKIDNPSFSKYEWYISSVHIKDCPTRYAIESWWRINIGWPPFCRR